VIVGSVFLLRSSALQVESVEVRGETARGDEIEESVSRYLAGSYAFIIPKTSSLLLSRTALESSLLRDDVRIKEADISTKNGVLVVDVEERVADALWCSYVDGEPLSPCVFIDHSFLAFSEAPFFSSSPLFVYMSEEKAPAIGETLYSKKERETLSDFVELLEKFSLNPKSLVVMQDGSVDMLLGHSGTPFSRTRLLLDKEEDTKRLESRLQTLLADSALRDALREEGGDRFAYIDMRFGNKIFYRVAHGGETVLPEDSVAPVIEDEGEEVSEEHTVENPEAVASELQDENEEVEAPESDEPEEE
jgi:hypothetical protein